MSSNGFYSQKNNIHKYINDLSKTQKIDINGEELEIQPIGSGSEVGRSCIILKFQNKKIMLDCGIHPAFSGLTSLPFFDEIDPGEIDLILITHFHLDHCGSLPYFLEKTNFHGECYMTHPTKSIYNIMLTDYINLSHTSSESLYNEQDIKSAGEKIKLLNYDQEIEYKGIKFTALNAGHVLGACMFLIEISGIKILYTGDYSREQELHLNPAKVPNKDINILIVESAFGTDQQEERDSRVNTFIKNIEEVVKRDGKCLLPVFALGRVQELLLIIDEHWEKNNSKLKDIPIYYATSLANDYIETFKKYINMSGDYIKNKFYSEKKNPFDFKHIKIIKTEQEIDMSKPCVVFASPGMLQRGLSKNLFKKWCTDKKNGIIITGYCVDKTLAREVLSEPKEIEVEKNEKKQLLMSVKNVSFSAHSDFKQTDEFIQALKPKNIVLVHGEVNGMKKLRTQIERLKTENNNYKEFNPSVYNPQNCQKIIIPFIIPKKGYIIGKLCEDLFDAMIKQKINGIDMLNSCNYNLNNGQLSDKMEIEEENDVNQNLESAESEENFFEVAGILIDEENILVNADEIEKFSNSNIKEFKLKQILKIKYKLCPEILLKILKDYFIVDEISPTIYKICSQIQLYFHKDNDIVLEWDSNGYSDFLANSIATIISQLENTPNINIFHHYSDDDNLCSYKKERLINYLKSKYNKVEEGKDCLIINDIMYEKKVKKELEDQGKYSAIIYFDKFNKFEVRCENEALKEQLYSDLEQFKEL